MRATEQFLRLVWPAAGRKAIVSIKQGITTHYWFEPDQFSEASDKALELSQRNLDVYMALGGFSEEQRKGEFATAFKCLFVDIDVDPNNDKKYPDQATARAALDTFLIAVGLPTPLVVSSGYGLHCYWPLDEDVDADEWKRLAGVLKQLCEREGFKTDPACTADAARILRPIGTFNRKNGTPRLVRPVEGTGTQIYTIDTLRNPLLARGGDIFQQLAQRQAAAATPRDTRFSADYPQADFDAILPRCATLRWAYENQHQVGEQLWYAALGVAHHCRDGLEVSHRLSRGHPGYDADATDRKRTQWVTRAGGPATCEHFKTLPGSQCNGCTANVTSPAALGRPRGAQATLSALIDNVRRFEDKRIRVNEDGLQVKMLGKKDEPPEWVKLSDHGIRPLLNIRLLDKDARPVNHVWMETYDAAEKGQHQFLIPSVTANQSTTFATECAKYGLVNEQELFPSAFRFYTSVMRNWIRKLEQEQGGIVTFDSFGWMGTQHSQSKDAFLLGNKLYTKEGVHNVPTLPHLREYQDAMIQRGTLEAWTAAMDNYNLPGLEPYMFASWAAWGAPLMPFTNSRNLVLSLVGDTGVGKSSLQHAIASVYGDYHSKILVDQNDSTINAVNANLGCLNSLPYIREEGSEGDPEELASWVLTMTQGRERGRLTSALTKAPIRTWSTIAILSSNTSIREIVINTRKDNAARLARTWEQDMHLPLSQEDATRLFRDLQSNYGLAGPIYIDYCTKNQEAIMQMVRRTEDALTNKYGSGGASRFFISFMAACFVGAQIALELGLIHHDFKRGRDWALGQFKRLTSSAVQEKQTPEQMLGTLVQEIRPNMLMVEYDQPNAAPTLVFDSNNNIIHAPTANSTIEARYAADTGAFYIAVPRIRKWYVDNHLNFRASMEALRASGVLIDEDKKVVLTKGTKLADKRQVRCLHFNLSKSTDLIDAIKQGVVS